MATYDDYNQPPPTGGYQEPPPDYAPRGSSGWALASLLFGLSSFCLACFTGVPAIIFGFMGLSSVRQSRGQVTGSGMAVTGIITGLLGTLCCTGSWGLIGWAVFVFMPDKIRPELDNNFVIQQHIGKIDEMTWNFEAMGNEQNARPPAPGITIVAFDVKGSKGSGLVIARVRQQGDDFELVEGTLETKGQKFELKGGPGERPDLKIPDRN